MLIYDIIPPAKRIVRVSRRRIQRSTFRERLAALLMILFVFFPVVYGSLYGQTVQGEEVVEPVIIEEVTEPTEEAPAEEIPAVQEEPTEEIIAPEPAEIITEPEAPSLAEGIEEIISDLTATGTPEVLSATDTEEEDLDLTPDPSPSQGEGSEPPPTGFLTPDGWKNISELEVGDEVIGFDLETNQPVTNTIENIEIKEPQHYHYYELDETGQPTVKIEPEFTYYTINNHYQLFRDQSVFANGRLVHASELSVGDVVYDHNNNPITITDIQEDYSQSQWIRLSVSGNHSYIADGLLLHNASRYWVGGGSSANWSATSNTNWGSASNTQDNASVPGASDDVFFDGVGTGASNSTISGSISINSLDMTGYANTLTHNGGITLTIGGNLFKMSAGMTYTLVSNTSSLSFTSTTGTSGSPTAITAAGKTFGNTTFNGTGGYFAPQDALLINGLTSGNLTLTDGTFAPGSNTLDVGGSVTVSAGVFNNSTAGMTVEGSLSVNGGTFNNTTVTFDDTGSTDDTTVTCTGDLGGTVVITKDTDGDFIVATDCSINLGADPVTTIDFSAVNDFVNNGTVVIPSGTWTVVNANAGTTRAVITNAGTITHSGNGWTITDTSLTNNGTITYAGTAITMDGSLTQNGTFDLTGKTITFVDDNGADDSTVACTGALGGTVVITKDTDGDFIVATDCSINLGADPTTIVDAGAANDFVNNGTIVIPSGTWVIREAGVDLTSTGLFTNAGTVTHSGSGWDINDISFTNSSTITYSGTTITMERSFTQNGTFDLSGKTITFDDSNTIDDSTITCTGSLGGTVVITKDNDGDFIVAADCSINLGADPTTTIDITAANDFVNNGTIVVPSGTWTIVGTGGGVFTNNGTTTISGSSLVLTTVDVVNNSGGVINHNGTGWASTDGSLTNNSGGTITFSGTAITMERRFTQNGTFDLSGKTITFDDSTSADDTTVTCTGTLGGTVVIIKDNDADFIVAADCSINLGADPTTTIDGGATNDFVNNGTIVIPSGTWTLNGSAGIFTNNGTTTHSGSGWDFNDASFTNVGTTTYAGTDITMERSFTQSGTFDLSGKTITFDDTDSSDTSTLTVTGALGGTVVINKTLGVFTLASGGSINLGDNPTISCGINTITSPCNSSGIFTGTGTLTAGTAATTTMNFRFNAGADFSGFTALDFSDDLNFIVQGATFDFSSYTSAAFYQLSMTSGSVTAPTGTMTIESGFFNSGDVFVHNNGTVAFSNSSGNQYVSDDTTFYNFTATVSSASNLNFEGGTTQTIENTLTLQGTSGNLLSLRSSTPGTQWSIDPQGTRTLSYLDVQDSNNVNSTAISADPTMTDSGNNSNWGFPTSTSSGSRRTQPVTIPPPPFIPLPPTPIPAIITPGSSTPQIVYDFNPTTLRLGDKGTAVMELQRFLNDSLNANLIVDGILGPMTTAVIKTWQSEHNLVADGIVGPLTKAAMSASTSIPSLPDTEDVETEPGQPLADLTETPIITTPTPEPASDSDTSVYVIPLGVGILALAIFLIWRGR